MRSGEHPLMHPPMDTYPTHYCHELTEHTVLLVAHCIFMGGQGPSGAVSRQKLGMLHFQIPDPVILRYSVSIYDKVILMDIQVDHVFAQLKNPGYFPSESLPTRLIEKGLSKQAVHI
jgi:hypothetical protein